MLSKIIALNPNNLAPRDVVEHIRPINVEYLDFKGRHQSGIIEIHEDLVDDVKGFFELSLEMEFPIEKVVKSSDSKYLWDDDKLLEDNASSGFNYRLIKGTAKPSLHSLGRAIDINTRLNPYIRYVDGKILVDPVGAHHDPSLKGTLAKNHPLVVFMKDRGWEWGGDWLPESGRTDYQHFQKAPMN